MNWIWLALKFVDAALLISLGISANTVVGPIYCEMRQKVRHGGEGEELHFR